MTKLIFLYLLLSLLISCGGGKKSESKLVVSLGSIVTENFTGGAVLVLENPTTGEKLKHTLVSPFVVQIPYGTWDFYFVGFEGSKSWEGPHVCGGKKQVNLMNEKTTVDINVTAAICSEEVYKNIIAGVSSTAVWDASKWDEAKWGP